MNIVFRAVVKLGKVIFDDRKMFDDYVWQFENKRVEIVVKKHRRSRTTGKGHELGNQNGYYRGVVVPVSAEALGYTQNEMHEVFLAEFAPFVYKDFGDKKVALKIRTSEMDTVQMSQFTEDCRARMAEFGVNIPDPVKVS